MATVLGLGFGLYVWALLAALGLGALVAASQLAYDVLRVAGAVVLVLLGVRALREASRQRAPRSTPEPTDVSVLPHRNEGLRAFAEGLLVQLANPKIAVFMLAFYPQFVPAGAPVLPTTAVLAAVQVLVETCLYVPVLCGVSRARSWLQRGVVRRWLEAVSGTALVGLGLRVATTSR
jgi:threonine/homoserine/homoserine lactone efflux protein